MEGVKICRIFPVASNDPRGMTREWKFDGGYQITSYERRGGTQFGGHYHRGDDPSKRPEHLLLVMGRVRATFEYNGQRMQTVLEAGDALTIAPMICHAMEALEDCLFIEFRFTHFDPQYPDTYATSLQ